MAMEWLTQVSHHRPRRLVVIVDIFLATIIIATTCTLISSVYCPRGSCGGLLNPTPKTTFSASTYQSNPEESDNDIQVEAKAFVDNKVKTFSKDSGQLKRRLPQCLVIGVRKGGTRAVLTFLDRHPDIVTAYNEQHFFGSRLMYSKGLEYYQKQMPLSSPHQLTIEKTPEYFTQYLAPERVYQMNSSIRLLLTVRDPVERLISDYAMKKEKAREIHRRYPALRNIVLDKAGDVNASARCVNISTYHAHYARWLTFFPRSQIHLIDGDKLARKPYIEMSKIETFLGIKPFLKKNVFIFNKTKGFPCVKGGDGPTCLEETKGRTHPDIHPKLIDKLKKYFKPKNEHLFNLAGERFDWE